MSICEEMNYASRELLMSFHAWAKEKGLEPNHLLVIIDWGIFTTQTHTVWTSFDHIIIMMNQAAGQIKQQSEGKTDNLTLIHTAPE